MSKVLPSLHLAPAFNVNSDLMMEKDFFPDFYFIWFHKLRILLVKTYLDVNLVYVKKWKVSKCINIFIKYETK